MPCRTSEGVGSGEWGLELGCEKGRGREGGWADAVDVGRGSRGREWRMRTGKAGWMDGEGEEEEGSGEFCLLGWMDGWMDERINIMIFI